MRINVFDMIIYEQFECSVQNLVYTFMKCNEDKLIKCLRTNELCYVRVEYLISS